MSQNVNQSMAGRALMIILGILALAIGFLAWIYPSVFFFSLIILFGIILVIAGILRLLTGIASGLSSNAQKVNVAFGLGTLILGILVLVLPEFAGITSIILIGIGFLIWGIGLLSFGLVADADMVVKIISALFGVLVIVVSMLMILDPTFGGLTFVIFASLGLIFMGIEALVIGILGVPVE